jgi:mannose-6-phosphate isomerase-like protein (cupin superfamily)
MPSTAWDTKQIDEKPDAAAPDGSEVRILCATPRGSTALFSLPPGAVARAVAHRTVDEIWYVIGGRGRLWRRLGNTEATVELAPGMSLTIPVGTHFQFRNDGDGPLAILGVTMPPWPGADEAGPVAGEWFPTV